MDRYGYSDYSSILYIHERFLFSLGRGGGGGAVGIYSVIYTRLRLALVHRPPLYCHQSHRSPRIMPRVSWPLRHFASGFTAEARTPEPPSPLRRPLPHTSHSLQSKGVLYVLRLVILAWSGNKTALLLPYIGHEGVDAVIVSSDL